jgi:hypothetical protein
MLISVILPANCENSFSPPIYCRKGKGRGQLKLSSISILGSFKKGGSMERGIIEPT